MRPVYWGIGGFTPGDRILARVEDWSAGVFSLEVFPASGIDSLEGQKWRECLEAALLQSFEINGPCASMDEQLAFAYFLDHERLFSPHGVSLGEFLDWSQAISIEPYGVETRLWHKDGEIPSQESWNLSLISTPLSLVEDAFVDMGLPLTQHIMESYVLDALYRREKDPSLIMERMVPLDWCKSAVCLPIISRAVHLRFKDLGETYNRFADDEPGSLRSRFLALHSALTKFLFSLQFGKISPNLIPDQGAVILGQLMSHTVSALENIDFPPQEDSADLDSLWASLESMEDSFFDIRTGITEMMPELERKRFSIVRQPEDSDGRN
jgi:hypothetical protein